MAHVQCAIGRLGNIKELGGRLNIGFTNVLARKLPNLPKWNIMKKHVQKVYTCIILYSDRYDLYLNPTFSLKFGKNSGITKSTIYVYSIYDNYYVNYTT